ncbi:hypothetical protein LTR91_007095 [Friedmanniomyces endolithicus]|uniref:C2H2-type domain-containing protein n=1 Tax=Friedmanniomyces endolithicus TaxID=329885 RepID=A0A4U0UW08_9PEZI|nr:hypothetical protein LTS09_007485 [Friedmanniomyces endolithicus]KAK0280434.1 hypothetical protein LTR35_008076 [Friedmanniomyces endolithicus]KAK0282214.1 hypothetical protein LTS00_012329 [Friedmanniomyces endolithicus]KAK0312908.1 hypothetical protein LTR01_002571 [Friedmanniomyces endolithicus]KAK0320462.1 hypothetical protein LTR82_008577 [Friedmanniomyces endolithicus]
MAKRLRHASTSSTASFILHAPKYASLEPDESPVTTASPSTTMRCTFPPHQPLIFPTYADYESHYAKAHTNRCTECSANLPTSHFLDLHLAENHDPLLASKRDRGEKTLACFVEDCEKVCTDWKKRRSHLVDKHGFPRNYDFLVVNTGVDGRRSMLRAGVDAQGHRKSSRERKGSEVTVGSVSTDGSGSTKATSVSEQAGGQAESDMDKSAVEGGRGYQKNALQGAVGSVDDLAESMSSLKMVPRSITFGRRKGGSGLARS